MSRLQLFLRFFFLTMNCKKPQQQMYGQNPILFFFTKKCRHLSALWLSKMLNLWLWGLMFGGFCLQCNLNFLTRDLCGTLIKLDNFDKTKTYFSHILPVFEPFFPFSNDVSSPILDFEFILDLIFEPFWSLLRLLTRKI